MDLRQLANMIPATTPIRIYRENNPYEPIISLVYSDSLRKGDFDFMSDVVFTVHSAMHDGLAYLIIHIN